MHKLGVDIREPFEVSLVDVGDDQLVGRREDGLPASEELVEVFGAFATLRRKRRGGRSVSMRSAGHGAPRGEEPPGRRAG